MPFIWNDDSYWERYKKSTKIFIKIIVPISIINILFWYIWTNGVLFSNIILLGMVSGAWFFTLINIYFQFPNAKIPDYYPKWVQTLMYIIHFLVASFVFYFIYTTLGVKIII